MIKGRGGGAGPTRVGLQDIYTIEVATAPSGNTLSKALPGDIADRDAYFTLPQGYPLVPLLFFLKYTLA